ncbi:MAG: hypothetical protein ACI9KN_002042 [Gammaproteobacteria bacterium]|jgi:hypothetical protein
MISKEQLHKAVDKGILQADQVQPLLAFLQDANTPGETNQEEPLKFIRSFGDIFISLGIGILVFSISMLPLSQYEYLIPIVGFILAAEWLVRVRRLALPGIAILVSILFLVHKAILFDSEQSMLLGFGLMSITSLIFYLRYKMPFSLLPLAGGIVAIAVTQIGAELLANPIIFSALGLNVFAFAMWFDIRDTRRQTHLSDSAFWLHLLAAPLIVHGAMLSMLLGDHSWLQALDKEFLVVIFFVGFLLLALLLDRRAMLISTQMYMIYALTQLVPGQFSSSQSVMIYILMGLGLFIIFFGTYWYKSRSIIFGFLAGKAIGQYVPDLRLQDVKK